MADARRRVALITGANRGLGLETSRQLLAQGLIVVLTGRDESALERAAASLGQDEERTMTVQMAYRRTFDTNVFGVIDVCRAFVPDMARARYGASSTCRQVRDSLRPCPPTRRHIQCRKQP